MTFDDWRALPPDEAARTFLRLSSTRLAPAQQRAVFSYIPSADTLAAAWSAADPDAPLGRVPFAIKDLFDLAGAPTFAGSTFLLEVRPTPAHDGALVQALRALGAVPVAKTQLHEFAYGITGENPHAGDCARPGFPDRTSGGSSSGSAAAVGAGIVPLALGSDTGGSVRLPAAFCGVWGFRCAPRHAWIADAVPLSTTFDTAGWFTANAADMRTTLAALVGLNPASHEPRGCFVTPDGLDDDVARAFATAAARLAPPADESARHEILRAFQPTPAAYGVITAVDAWAYHAPWADRFRDRYDPAVWQRLQRARSLSPTDVAATQATLMRTREFWAAYFRTHDFLLLPASPCGALLKAECTPFNRERILALTAPASLGGLPVLTIPLGLPSGLTTGLQFIVPCVDSPAIAWALRRWQSQ